MKKSKLVFIAGLGTMFESFDFYLFSLFAIQLNYAFFGSVNKHSVLWIFIIFAVGYLARISGALIFGYWGDKIGRLYSFKKTIVIMALSSIAIAFIPSHQSIGLFAVVFLITLRFIQGISFGWELSGAVIVIVENFKKHRALSIMCISIMASIGLLLANFIYTELTYYLSHQYMMNYGWRVAYVFGGLALFHSYFARKDIAESDEFKLCLKRHEYKNSIKVVFKDYKILLLLGILSLMGVQLYWGTIFLYFPQYIQSSTYLNISISSINYTATIGLVFGYVIGACVAELTSIKLTYTLFTIASLVMIISVYLIITNTHFSVEYIYFLVLVLSLFQGACGVLCLLMMAEKFPLRYRYSLLAIAFALSAFLFVGIPPFIFSYFTRESSM